MSVVATFRRLSGKRTGLSKASQALISEVTDAMNAQVLTALDIMQSEPPPKAGSRYIRTHRYANSWRPIFARPSGGRLQAGIAGNAVDNRGHNYTVVVGGDEHGEGQIGMHEETGWPLAVEALEGRTSGVFLTKAPQPFDKRIKRAVRKAFS